MWVVIVYIINGCVTRNNLDDRSYCGYFIGYAATTNNETDFPELRRIFEEYFEIKL